MPGVVVIDDDRSVVLLIRAACKQDNVAVEAAETAEQGLELLKEDAARRAAAGRNAPRCLRARPVRANSTDR